MTDQPTYTLEQAAEARRQLIRTFAEVLSLVPQDIEDDFGANTRVSDTKPALFDLNDKQVRGRIAEMMIDRMLAWPEVIIVYPTPDGDHEVDPKTAKPFPFTAGIMPVTDAGWRMPSEQAYDFPSREEVLPNEPDEEPS